MIESNLWNAIAVMGVFLLVIFFVGLCILLMTCLMPIAPARYDFCPRCCRSERVDIPHHCP